MTSRIDDEKISRFLDGELDDAHVAGDQHTALGDHTLTPRADQIRGQEKAIRDWFEGKLPAPSPTIEQSIRTGFAERRAHHHRAKRSRWWLPAAAAAAVLFVGFAAFNQLIDSRVEAALDQMRVERASDIALLTSAMQEVLETRESGVKVSFRNTATGLSVTMIPRRTWKSASGHWCREFVESIGNAPIEKSAVTTACRSSNGLWKRVRTELPGGQVPLQMNYSGAKEL